jgi:hypothetical protein
MDDINLIGDDKQQENDFNNDDYSSNYEADSREFSSDSDFPDSDLDHNIYDRSYAKSGSKKTAYIIGGVVIAVSILVIGYLIVNSSKSKTDLNTNIDSGITSTPSQAVDTSLAIIPEKPVVGIPSFAREMIGSTQQGVKTVETILATIPQDINFTMIQYRDGNFLTELLGKSASRITELNNQLQQNMVSGKVNILSRDKKNIQGYSYQQALLNGNVSASAGEISGAPNYIDPNSVKNEFSNYCGQYGLNVKQFDVKNEIIAEGYKKTPVLFRAVGNRDSALNLLNKIVESNINVNLSKIVLVASDRNLKDGKVSLILNLEVYHPI